MTIRPTPILVVPKQSTLIFNRSVGDGVAFYHDVLVKSWPLSSSSAAITITLATRDN